MSHTEGRRTLFLRCLHDAEARMEAAEEEIRLWNLALDRLNEEDRQSRPSSKSANSSSSTRPIPPLG